VPATDKVFHDRPGELALQKTLQRHAQGRG
jgi:hypothetical protein